MLGNQLGKIATVILMLGALTGALTGGQNGSHGSLEAQEVVLRAFIVQGTTMEAARRAVEDLGGEVTHEHLNATSYKLS